MLIILVLHPKTSQFYKAVKAAVLGKNLPGRNITNLVSKVCGSQQGGYLVIEVDAPTSPALFLW